MRIAAILSVAKARQADGTFPVAARSETRRPTRFLSDTPYALADVLGQSVLNRMIARLQPLGTLPPSVIAPEGGATLLNAWENAVAHYISNSVDMLLLVRVNAYTDIDYRELIEYHRETQSPLTQVYAGDGALDIALVDARLLRNAEGGYRRALRTLIPKQRHFSYNGYVNRLRQPQEFYQLMADGLTNNCGLQPVGQEVQDRVWVGENAHVDSSASLTSPVFIGAGARVQSCCQIAGPSAIERGCTIDCGTTITESYVLPDSYIGVALSVRNAVVGHRKLFHLRRNIEVSIADRRLIGANTKSIPFLPGLASLLGARAIVEE